jgi:hypothetical protein
LDGSRSRPPRRSLVGAVGPESAAQLLFREASSALSNKTSSLQVSKHNNNRQLIGFKFKYYTNFAVSQKKDCIF